MIQGEVLQELIPSRRYKVRIMNNKPLKDDIRKTLNEEAAKVQEALDEIQKKYDDYNAENRINSLKIDIERLEQHEEQTLSVLNKINRLERQIFNITVIQTEMKRTFKRVAQELRNVNVQLIRLNNEPDYFDFDVWCSNYRKWNVGDTVPLVSNGYDVKDWVILPDWEFNKESAGFGNSLTSKHLLETYEWVYSQIKLNENVNNNITKYGKAKIIYRDGDKVSIQVEFARIWDMGIVSRQRTQEVYINCSTIYTQGAYIPYFIGAEVLVKFYSRWQAEVIGFWQEPVKPFSISSPFSYEKKLLIEVLPDKNETTLSAEDNFGYYKKIFNGKEFIESSFLTKTFPNINIWKNGVNDYKTVFVGMVDNYPEPDILHSDKDSGKFWNFFNKHNRSYNSAIIPNAANYYNMDSNFDGDTNYINDGLISNGYIKTSRSTGYRRPYIRFLTNQMMWNNSIVSIDDNYNCVIRSGVVHTPPCYNLIFLAREDGTNKIASFGDQEIQSYLQRFLDNRNSLYQNNKSNLQPLFNPRTGNIFNDYDSFFSDCLSSSGFYSQNIIDSIIIEQTVNLENLLSGFNLNNLNSTNNFATTFYYGNVGYERVDQTYSSSVPNLDVNSNLEAVEIFRDYKKPKHSDVQDDVILINGTAHNQFDDWYVRNVTKTDNYISHPDLLIDNYEKNLQFEYYKINYIE